MFAFEKYFSVAILICGGCTSSRHVDDASTKIYQNQNKFDKPESVILIIPQLVSLSNLKLLLGALYLSPS